MAARYLLSNVVLQQAIDLLRLGTPKTEVQRRLRIGEGTVYRIVGGTQTAKGAQHERCGGCGGKQLANQPCRVCRDRRALRRTQ